jgi:hypothetical protein
MSLKTKNEVAKILGYKNATDFTTQNKDNKTIEKFYNLVLDRISLKRAILGRTAEV